MGQIPDWLALMVSVAGLFVGGAGGTYYGARRRSRLDDRRHLLYEHVEIFLRGAEQDTGPKLDPVLQEFDDYFGIWLPAANLTVAIAKSPATVRLLPWTDRALWRRMIRCIESGPYWEAYVRLFHKYWAGEYRTPNVGPLRLTSSEELDQQLAQLMADNSEEQWAPYRRAVRDFQNHLIRQVNPTFRSRFSAYRQQTDLWVRGPRPWSSEIAITNDEPYEPEERDGPPLNHLLARP